jgi:cell division protein FtsQ
LLLAAISSKKNGECSDYSIVLKGPRNNFFINEKDVEEMLMRSNDGAIKGRSIESFHLNELEKMLKQNTWISKAELYFDNNNVLHVTVTEKEPAARVFSTTGSSFYIDSAGNRMPLSDKLSAKVPVFTNFPGKKELSSKDSALLNDVKQMANYINSSSFWMSQVAQMDITADRKFEMIPVVGNHLVRLGDGENIPAKFNRLMIFYKQVLSKTGFDRYKIIDVQYKGQVVASRYAGDPKVDSVQLRKNVEKLLKQSAEAANDTVARTALPPVVKLEPDAATTDKITLPENQTVNPEQDPNPRLDDPTPAIRQTADGGQAVKASAKTGDKPKPVKPKTTVKKEEPKKPKAVMPKKTEEEENAGYN